MRVCLAALITRALIVLEGIALTGDKSFDLFDAAYPYALKHAASLFGGSQVAQMLSEVRALHSAVAKGAGAAVAAPPLAVPACAAAGAAVGLSVHHEHAAGDSLAHASSRARGGLQRTLSVQ